MKFSLIALLFVFGLLARNGAADAQAPTPCKPTGPLASDSLPTGGWIGSPFEGFEALYGKSTSASPLFNEYDIEGCGSVMVDETEGFITSIMLFSPRKDEDKSYLIDADDADWEITYAMWIAQSFLPPDATIIQDIDLASTDDWYQNGYSQSLMDSVPPSVYEYVSYPPVAYGGFQVWYTRPPKGHGISMITIQLQTEQVESVS